MLGGLPDAAPWTPLAIDREAATFYAGAAEIELYRSETENYRGNLASGAPSIWVALQASGDLDKLDGPLFGAIHEEHLQLYDEQSLADWVGKNGGGAEKFAAAYTSFGVNNQTVQADQMVEHYRIEAVPTMVVNGEYAAMGKNFAEILANTDHLIAQVQTEARAAGTPAKHK